MICFYLKIKLLSSKFNQLFALLFFHLFPGCFYCSNLPKAYLQLTLFKIRIKNTLFRLNFTSNKRQPKLQMSTSLLYLDAFFKIFFFNNSIDIYINVPTNDYPFESVEKPKSAILNSKLLLRTILSSFISLCIILRSFKCINAETIY